MAHFLAQTRENIVQFVAPHKFSSTHTHTLIPMLHIKMIVIIALRRKISGKRTSYVERRQGICTLYLENGTLTLIIILDDELQTTFVRMKAEKILASYNIFCFPLSNIFIHFPFDSLLFSFYSSSNRSTFRFVHFMLFAYPTNFP